MTHRQHFGSTGTFLARSRNRKGVALPMMAILALTFLAFIALVTDGGLLLFHKRRMQAAADAAAWAGAQEVLRERREWGYLDDVVAGREGAEKNGFENGVDGTIVTINRPPMSGNFATADYVEAIVEQPMPTFFIGSLFGMNSVAIRARAVAGLHGEASVCIQALEPTAQRGIQISGTPLVNIDCVGWSNSCNKTDSVSIDGASIVQVEGLNYCEGGQYTGTGSLTCSDPTVNCPATAAPLADVLLSREEPDYSMDALYSAPKEVNAGNGDIVTVTPGYYQAAAAGQPGIKISQGAIVTFESGFYVVNGMDITGDPATTQVTGQDVTFFSVGPQLVTINGAFVDFDAPDTGEGYTADMDNVFFWCKRGSTDKSPGHKFAGGGNSDTEGIFYCPDQDVEISGNADVGGWMMLITNQLKITGTANLGSINPAPVGVIPELVEVNFVE